MVLKLSVFAFLCFGVVAIPAEHPANLKRPNGSGAKISQNATIVWHAKSTRSLIQPSSSQPRAAAPPKTEGGATIQADCKTATVGSPYSIWTAAGITETQFYSYNPGTNCSPIQPGQKVCVSAGTLPSDAPHQNPDGSCYVYTVVSGDICGALAAKYTITVANIGAWNAKTYKWKGCNALQIGQKICLSTGTPPPPPQDPNLQCGPESVGNKTCPLKACCSPFGCDDAQADNGGSCNFDQEGFKAMQYFYDAVGRQSSLHNDKGEWHSDWMSLNARGAQQYARQSGDTNYGNIWYAVASNDKQTPWTHISGMSPLVAATKRGTC